MSRRAEIKRAENAVRSEIADLREKFTLHGLPADVLVRAFDGYGSTELSWPQLRSKALDFERYLQSQVSHCTIRTAVRRPLGKRRPATSLALFRLMDAPLRERQTLFGAHTFTFTFWPNEAWFLRVFDVLCTTNHLHQRLIERGAASHFSLAKTQDDLSLLWPMFEELHRQRRHRGLIGGISHFVTPVYDGLVFGEFQQNDFGGLASAADAPPVLLEFSNGLAVETRLHDYYSNGAQRLMVIARTYIGTNELSDGQRKLKLTLDQYIRRHRIVVECWKLRTRLAFDAERCGREHYKLYVDPRPRPSRLKEALGELDQITSSQPWKDEMNRNLENLARSREKFQNTRD